MIETTIHVLCECEITNYYDKTIKSEFGPLNSINIYNPEFSNNEVKKMAIFNIQYGK